MAFLNPLIAAFAALGAVPIIIHLLNRRRFRIIVWAAMEFLLSSLKKNKRRLQLRDIILMLIRAAAVILMALALARPTIAGGVLKLFGGGGQVGAAIVLDNSLSMGFSAGLRERFKAAKEVALKAASGLGQGSEIALVLMSDVAAVELPGTPDLAFALGAIENCRRSDGGTAVQPALEEALKLLKRMKQPRRDCILVTDMQASAWPAPDEEGFIMLLSELSKEANVYVVSVDDGGRENVAVSSLEATDEIVTIESEVVFTARVTNVGSGSQTGVSVNLILYGDKGEERKRVSKAVDVEAGGEASVSLTTRFRKGGERRVKVELGPDRLLADNVRHLALPVIERMKVLIVDASPSDDPWESESAFLRYALAPADPENPDRKGLIESAVVPPYRLGEKPLSDYDLVVLADVNELSEGKVRALETYCARGGAVMFFPGGRVTPREFNALYGRMLPASLSRAESDDGWTFATSPLDHAIVSFFSPDEYRAYLSRPTLKKRFGMRLEGVESTVALKFHDGAPALVERKLGRGKVMLWAFPADRDWGDLPLRVAYLPLMRRSAEYAALGARERRNVLVHEGMRALLAIEEQNVPVTVRDPAGRTRQVLPSPSGDHAVVEFTGTDLAGFYELALEGKPARYFAANPPPRESDLTALTEDDLRSLYPGFRFTLLGPRDDVASVMKKERVGIEVWPYLIAMVFALLLAESILALRWAPRE